MEVSEAKRLVVLDRRLRHLTRRKSYQDLGAHEFMRRFLLHVLPRGFHRIRHFIGAPQWRQMKAGRTAGAASSGWGRAAGTTCNTPRTFARFCRRTGLASRP